MRIHADFECGNIRVTGADGTHTFASFFRDLPGCRLAFTLETTYFGTVSDRVTEEKLLGTGRAFCRAVRQFAAQCDHPPKKDEPS